MQPFTSLTKNTGKLYIRCSGASMDKITVSSISHVDLFPTSKSNVILWPGILMILVPQIIILLFINNIIVRVLISL